MHAFTMSRFIPRTLAWVFIFSYGIFTVLFYSGIALMKGTYFKRPTDKQKSELQLGELSSIHQ